MRSAIPFFGLLGALLSIHHVTAVPQSQQLDRRAEVIKESIIWKTEVVTDLETIRTTRGAVTVTVKGTSTVRTTRKVAATSAAASTDDEEVVTVTSTTTTTLPPKTITSAQKEKRGIPAPTITPQPRPQKRQVRAVISEIREDIMDFLDGDKTTTEKTTTKTVKVTGTIKVRTERTITQTVNGGTATVYSKEVTVTVDETTGRPAATGEPVAPSTTTVWVTETATPDPVIVKGNEGEKKEEGMTSGQKAGLGASLGILGALGLGFAAFVIMKKRKRNMDSNEKVDFNRLGPEDAYDPSMRGSPDMSMDHLPAHPPPPNTSTAMSGASSGSGAAGMAAIAAGAGLAGAAARSRQQPHSPVSDQGYESAQNTQFSSTVSSARTSEFAPGFAAGAAIGAAGTGAFDRQEDSRSVSPPDQHQIQPPQPVASPLSGPGDPLPPTARPIPPHGAMGAHRLSMHPDILTPGVLSPEQRRMSSFQPAVGAVAAFSPNPRRNSRSPEALVQSPSQNSSDNTIPTINTASSGTLDAATRQQNRISKYTPGYSGPWGTKYTPVTRKAVPNGAEAGPSGPTANGDTGMPPSTEGEASAVQPPPRAYAPYRPDSIVVTPATPVLAHNPALKRNSAWEKASEY